MKKESTPKSVVSFSSRRFAFDFELVNVRIHGHWGLPAPLCLCSRIESRALSSRDLSSKGNSFGRNKWVAALLASVPFPHS